MRELVRDGELELEAEMKGPAWAILAPRHRVAVTQLVGLRGRDTGRSHEETARVIRNGKKGTKCRAYIQGLGRKQYRLARFLVLCG